MHDYTRIRLLRRQREREAEEFMQRRAPVIYVAERVPETKMLNYHRLASEESTEVIDAAMPFLAEWTPDQIADFGTYVLGVHEPARLATMRRRLFRLVVLHGDAASGDVLDVLARALFHCLSSERDDPFELPAPPKPVGRCSMIDMHTAVTALQTAWFRAVPGPDLHRLVERVLVQFANLVEFEYDPPGAMHDHAGWMDDGAPSAAFTLMGLSLAVDYLRAHERVSQMPYAVAEVALTPEEAAAAREWFRQAMGDADTHSMFQKKYSQWVAAPGLFGMYRMTVPEFPYIPVSVETVRKRTCLTKIFPRLATIVRTPQADMLSLLDSEDALAAACGDAAFLSALASVMPQATNTSLEKALEVHDFFQTVDGAEATRIGGAFFFHATRTRVHGLLPALKYWLPSLLNGERLRDDIFRHGRYSATFAH